MTVHVDELVWRQSEQGKLTVRQLSNQSNLIEGYQEIYHIQEGFRLVRNRLRTDTPIYYPAKQQADYIGVCFAFAQGNQDPLQVAYPHLYQTAMSVTNGYNYKEQTHQLLGKNSYYVSLQFSYEFLIKLQSQYPLPKWLEELVMKKNHYIVKHIQVPMQIRELAWKICQQPKAITLSDKLHLEALALTWFADLCQINTPIETSYQSSTLVNQNVLKNIVTMIEQNYHQDLTIKKLAQKFIVNECYLKMAFKEFTGKTIHEYLTHQRLKQACQLLQYRHDLSIKHIAIGCGYQPSHFSQVFKSYFSMSPSEYQQQYK